MLIKPVPVTFYRFGLKWICSYEALSFDVYVVYDETMGNGYLGNIEGNTEFAPMKHTVLMCM